jgi:hypothetical protein
MGDRNLRDDDIDRLGHALISLTQELWVMKDRQRVLEAALSKAGIIPDGTIDSFRPDEALQGKLDGERQQLIDNVINVLTKSTE